MPSIVYHLEKDFDHPSGVFGPALSNQSDDKNKPVVVRDISNIGNDYDHIGYMGYSERFYNREGITMNLQDDLTEMYEWMKMTLNSLSDALSLNFFRKGLTECNESVTIYNTGTAEEIWTKLREVFNLTPGYMQFRGDEGYFRQGDEIPCVLKVVFGNGDSAWIRLKGTKEVVEEVKKNINASDLVKRKPQVERISFENSRFLTKSFQLATHKEVKTDFYPYMDQSPEDLWDDFNNSGANILMLIGEPGTGKSNFIRQMMEYRGYDNVPYLIDNELLLLDPMLISFLQSESRMELLIAEDADNFVAKRDDSNRSMVGLLNMSSGVAAGNTKIILSTNLPNLNRVDPALVRPGRCFKVLTFDKLSVEQCEKISSDLGLSRNFVEPRTLAELLNDTNGSKEVKKSFGFSL